MASDDWTPVDEKEAVSSGWLDTANDFGRAVSNAATFGMANRAKGYISGTGTDEQARLSEVARERSPYASIAGDVYGAFGIPALGAENLALRTGAAIAKYAPKIAPVIGRMVGYGTTAAVTGGLQGAGNTYTGNPWDYAENALIGAAIAVPFGAAGGAIFGRRPAVSAAKVPDVAEQEAAKNIAYRALEQHPAQYTLPAFGQRGADVEAALRARNAHELTSPQSFRTVEQMSAPPTAVAAGRSYVSPADVDFIRKGVTGDELAGMTPTDKGSARIVRQSIDDFLRNPPPGAAVPGTAHLAADASRVADTAHQLYGGLKRTEALEELVRNAGRTASATHSGLNLRNELQKAVRTGLKEKKGDSPFSKTGYNADELAALDKFSRGQGMVSQGLGYADKYLGGGGGLGALAAGAVGGHYLGGEDKETAILKGLGVSGLGLGLRVLGNRRATADINRLRDVIAQRNPLYEARAATAGMKPGPGSPLAAKAVRDALALALLKQQTQPEQKYESW